MIRHFWQLLKQLKPRAVQFPVWGLRMVRRAGSGIVRSPAFVSRCFVRLAQTAGRLQPSQSQLAVGVLLGSATLGFSMMEVKPVGGDVAVLTKSIAERPAPPPMADPKTLHVDGRVAIMMQISMLQEAIDRLSAVDSYTTEFRKQERIGGLMLGEQMLEMKVRHKPFNVYMKLLEADEDVGREVLYPIAVEDRRLIVKVTRLLGRVPPLKLEVSSDMAMKESRYPITMAGMLALAQFAKEVRQRDLQLGDRVRASMRDDREFDGRPTYTFMVEYQQAEDSPEFRKCIVQIDKESMLPVMVKNYTWPGKVEGVDHNKLDETTLLETYSFTKINLKASLADKDFDFKNEGYKFQ